MALHTKILIGLVLGAVLGVATNIFFHGAPAALWIVDNVAQPVGQVFIRFLFMVVVPLVFTSVTLGVASLGDLRRIGRVGGKTIAFFLATTALAAVIGVTLVNTLRPGDSLDPAVRTALLHEYATQAGEKVAAAQQSSFGVDLFVNMVPRNPVSAAASGDMLGLIFFSIVFGIALTRLSAERAAPVIRLLEGIADAVMVIIGFAMKFAPIGVMALLFSVTAKFGYGLLQSLGLYVVTVLLGLALHQFGVFGLLIKLLVGMSPRTFFHKAREVMITAFSTSSSNATLPTTIRVAERNFGVPPEIAGFILPLGSTINMNGGALFEGVTVLFLAQVFGVHLGLAGQFIVIVMSIIAAVGASGVPSGGIPMLVMVLGVVGVPAQGIGLILGIDRIVDMCRTVPNVTGDLLTAIVIAKSEGLPLVVPVVDDDASEAA